MINFHEASCNVVEVPGVEGAHKEYPLLDETVYNPRTVTYFSIKDRCKAEKLPNFTATEIFNLLYIALCVAQPPKSKVNGSSVFRSANLPHIPSAELANGTWPQEQIHLVLDTELVIFALTVHPPTFSDDEYRVVKGLFADYQNVSRSDDKTSGINDSE